MQECCLNLLREIAGLHPAMDWARGLESSSIICAHVTHVTCLFQPGVVLSFQI